MVSMLIYTRERISGAVCDTRALASGGMSNYAGNLGGVPYALGQSRVGHEA